MILRFNLWPDWHSLVLLANLKVYKNDCAAVPTTCRHGCKMLTPIHVLEDTEITKASKIFTQRSIRNLLN